MKQKPTHRIPGKPVIKATVKKEAGRTSAGPGSVSINLDKYGLWITLGLVSVLILIIFTDFITGSKYYLFKDIGSDTLNGWYTNIVLISKYLHTDGFPLWSHSQGLGQNLMAVSVTDPFSFIVYLFGQNNLAYGIVWMEICKIILTSVFMYLFFRLWKISPILNILGSVLYCFGGFMIVGGAWFGFSTEAFLMVFLLYSFEKLYRDGTWYLFPLSVALITSNQPINLYFYGLFLIFYFLFRYFSSENHSWRNFGKLTLQMTGLTLTGLLISSFFLVSQMQMLLDSPRVGGNSSHAAQLLSKPLFFIENGIYYATAIMRLFSNDLIGNGSNFHGWYNYLEAPMWYIGILPLLLMPQVFVLGSRRKKIAYGCFFLILLIPVILPFFRYAFWLFTGDYYRGYSIFISLFLLFSAIDVLNEVIHGKKINLLLLGVTLGVVFLLLYYPFESTSKFVDTDLRTVIANFIVIYAILVFLLKFEKYRSLVVFVLVVVVGIELAYMNNKTVNNRLAVTRNEMMEKAGYNDYTVDAIGFLKSHDHQYFRVNKDYTSDPAIHTSFNDAKVQGYYGSMSYHSFNQKYYIRFLEEMNIIQKGEETQTRAVVGLVAKPLLQNLVSTKYNLCKRSIPPILRMTYDSIARFGNVTIMRNNHFLPLGFTYDTYIPESQLLSCSERTREQILQEAVAAAEPVDPGIRSLRQFELSDTLHEYTFIDYFKDIDSRKKDTLQITKFTENRIKGTISLKEKKLLFFSIPYDKGWHAVVDGNATQPVLCNLGFMGLLLSPGDHHVELYYRPPFYNPSLWITIVSLLAYLAMISADRSYFRKKAKKEDVQDL